MQNLPQRMEICQTKHEIKVGSKSGHVCRTCNHVASRKKHLLKHFKTKKNREAEVKANIAHVSNHISEMPVILDGRVDVIDDQQRIPVEGIEEVKNSYIYESLTHFFTVNPIINQSLHINQSCDKSIQ